MARKTYSQQFKRDAVSMYEDSEASMVRIAEDLGINRGTLNSWVQKFGTGKRARRAEEVEKARQASDAEKIRQLEQQLALVEEERDILRKAAQYFAKGDDLVIRFKFIDDYRNQYSVKRICSVLKINRSSYYKWKEGEHARQQRLESDALLGARIKIVFEEKNGLYGAKRVTADLNDQPDMPRVNHKRVARIMKQMGLKGFSKKRRVVTTDSRKTRFVFADLVGRNFTAEAPGQLKVGDITYLPVAGGTNLYLATVIDCYSRLLVGFAIADHMRSPLVEEALINAKNARGSLTGAIFHSDHGSVYASTDYQKLCTDYGITQSMGKVGSSADNALAESFNATVKREVLRNAKCFPNALVARREVFAWCVRYNTQRRHSYCNYMSPQHYETTTCGNLALTA
ncbi:IS3 family transposase [Corynebacterium cystitidis]|uniref:IS3 family transposase n=1 Tax=Corynebacterium cystitidis TaxID=35757 RepID=UPI00358DB42F